MDLKKIIPQPDRIALEIIATLIGVLGAAYIISKFPKAQTFVQQNSVTVKDQAGQVLF